MKLIDQNDRTFTHGDLIPVGEMRDYVREGYFKDYDGHGYPVKVTGEVGHVDSTRRWVPSFGFLLVPKDTTHILWFNK